jgi:precorrin-2 dehydrogenase / sirohydrochlorin ferrochelatase
MIIRCSSARKNIRRPAPESEGVRNLLPLFIDLEDKVVAIFGGGKVAERKAGLFSQYSNVRVISKEFTKGLYQMEREGSVSLTYADLSVGLSEHLAGAFLAVPATSNKDLNLSIEIEASRLGVLVNKVDGVGEVVVPSIIRKDPVTLAISTLGRSPALSKHIRLRLEEVLTEDYSAMARLLSEIRAELKEEVSSQEARSEVIWQVISDQEVWDLLKKDSYDKAYIRAREHLRPR